MNKEAKWIDGVLYVPLSSLLSEGAAEGGDSEQGAAGDQKEPNEKVEGWVMDKERLIAVFKEVSLFDLSDCEFEYGTEDDVKECWANALANGRVIDSISWDGNIFRMMDNDGTFKPLNPMIDGFGAAGLLQSKEGWVSVETPPEIGVRVYLAIDSIGETYTCIGKLKANGLYYKDSGTLSKPMETVIAWMPLPNPPQKTKQDGK